MIEFHHSRQPVRSAGRDLMKWLLVCFEVLSSQTAQREAVLRKCGWLPQLFWRLVKASSCEIKLLALLEVKLAVRSTLLLLRWCSR